MVAKTVAKKVAKMDAKKAVLMVDELVSTTAAMMAERSEVGTVASKGGR